jgi:DNA-binding NarL/FixJ family response regulator
MRLRILIGDSHEAFRKKLRALLVREGLSVVGEACDGEQLLNLARALTPDVAVLDFSLPGLNGVEATHEVSVASPKTRTILLTVHSEIEYIMEAFRAKFDGFVVKRRVSEELVKAIHEISRGGSYLCSIGHSTILREFLGGNNNG